MFCNIKTYKVLALLIFMDISITVFAVKYLGAVELNPLCFDFDLFVIIKTVLSIVCISLIYIYHEDKYVKYATLLCILIYTIAAINYLWHTVNYLYY